MNKLLLTLVSIFGLISAVEIEDGVLVLTDDTFDEELAKHPFMLIEFYAPWCGHCKKLAPEFAAAAQALAEQDRETPIVLAKVDCDQNKQLKSRFSIQTFPTLFWFTDGIKHQYNGGRTTDTILHWLDQKTGPAYKEFETCDEMQESTEKKKFNLIYFGDSEGADFDVFKGQWQEPDFGDNPKFAFIHGRNECAERYQGAVVPGFVLVRNFDEPVTRGIAEPNEVKNWIKSHQFPYVINFDEDAIKPVFADRKQSLVLFTNEDEQNDYSRVFAVVAKELHGEVLFVKCGTKSKIDKQLSGFMKITDDQLPALRIMAPGKSSLVKYNFEGSVRDVNIDQLKQFVMDFKADKLSPFYRSEDVPASQDAPITQVVGKTFEQIVKDSTKDVIIYFYSDTTCKHCVQVDKFWNDLAVQFAEVPDLIVAKMDSGANEVENLVLKNLPNIKFYSRDNKEGEALDDFRTIKQFAKYLEENSAAVQEYRAAQSQQQEEQTKSEDL